MNENDPSTETTEPKSKPISDTAGAPAASVEGSPAEIQRLESELAEARKSASENYERYLRSMADLENFRKRTIREKDDLRQFAASRVLEDLIPVLDSLGLGLTAAKAPNADIQTVVGGVEMVLTQAKTALAQHGFKEINPVGQVFDPNLHESVSAQPSREVKDGSVISVVRIGYSLNGRVLRPATVVISSGAAGKTMEASS